jgi:hypothetical protein
VPCTRKRASVDAAGGVLEDADEQLADGLALLLGVGDAGRALEEAVGGPHVDELDALVRWKVSTTCSPSPLRIRPVSTNTQVSWVADGLVHQRGGDRRVDAARQPADGPLVADLGADGLDRVSMIEVIVQVGRQSQAS